MKLKWNLWFRVAKWIGIGVCAAALARIACAQSIGTTTVHGTVYLANGTTGSGSLLVSWPAFTTSDSKAVAAGHVTVAIGQDGAFSVNLAPNLGSSPAGLYYTVVFHLSDGTTSTEYWVVPPGDPVSTAQVRAQVMPAAQAVQAASKAYVDQAIQSISPGSLTSTGGALTGPLYLNGDPTQPLQAADKRYVDTEFALAAPLTGGTMSDSLTLKNNADGEIDSTLQPGLTTSQKGAFTYKDWNGTNQWSMVKDTSNNWSLYSAASGVDSLKAYQSGNSGDTYVNASSPSGVVRVNYENGAGSAFNVYGGSSNSLYASFSGPSSIKFPGISSASGQNCLQIDAAGSMTSTGAPCSMASGTVHSGTSGQIAYYTGSGTTIGGTNAVPITAGGTGASTAAGALMALAAASLATSTAQSFAGPINAPAVSASVNSQINVMSAPYNAKGDCVTDDHDAIMAAQTAAMAMRVGDSGPATLYFPKPPGGCYLTSTIRWLGVSLEGQPQGVSAGSAGVIIRGKPGQDIFHGSDPTTTAYPVSFNQSWSIRHISFELDDTVAGNFPHRWPGHWFDDASMTAGSNVLNLTNTTIKCGDIGQAIQVNGAGPGGTNLVTTVATVSPCWNTYGSGTQAWLKVTLAAAASTSVTNAHTYLSVLGFPVTYTVGAASIAMDDVDGNPNNWVTPNQQGVGIGYSQLENVNFYTVSYADKGQNNSVAYFTQGQWGAYGLKVSHTNVVRYQWGVVQVCPELNSVLSSCSNDYQRWEHMDFNATYPWISYNGGYLTMTDIQLTAQAGPQFLLSANDLGDSFGNAKINIAEFENGPNPTTYGMRVQGLNSNFDGSSFSNAGMMGIIEAAETTCEGCLWTNLTVYGNGNTIHAGGDIAGSITTIDGGRGNSIDSHYTGAPFRGLPLNQRYAKTPYKGSNTLAGRLTTDFLDDGNTVPYNHDDLFIWPKDVFYDHNNGEYVQQYADDSTSPTGGYIILTQNSWIQAFSQFVRTPTGGNIRVGTTLPAAPVTIYLYAKCPSGVTSLQVNTLGGNSPIFSCTTSYQVYSFTMDWTSSSGNNVNFNSNLSTAAYLAWIYIRPFIHDINGMTFAGTGPAITTGPNSTTTNDLVTYSNVTGQQQDSGVQVSSLLPKANPAFTGTLTGSAATIAGALSGQYFLTNANKVTTAGPTYSPDLTKGSIQQVVVTADTTIVGPSNESSLGNLFAFQICQDSVGGHDISLSGSYPGGVAPGSAPNSCVQQMWFSADNYALYPVGAAIDQNGMARNAGLAGVTGSIGGSALTAGGCASGAATVTGAATGMVVIATPSTYPGDAFDWNAYVSGPNTVTVRVCTTLATGGTPAASTYNVRVIQ